MAILYGICPRCKESILLDVDLVRTECPECGKEISVEQALKLAEMEQPHYSYEPEEWTREVPKKPKNRWGLPQNPEDYRPREEKQTSTSSWKQVEPEQHDDRQPPPPPFGNPPFGQPQPPLDEQGRPRPRPRRQAGSTVLMFLLLIVSPVIGIPYMWFTQRQLQTPVKILLTIIFGMSFFLSIVD